MQTEDSTTVDEAAGTYWPAAGFTEHVRPNTLWKAAHAGRVRWKLNRTGTRRLYCVDDVYAEWPHLFGTQTMKNSESLC